MYVGRNGYIILDPTAKPIDRLPIFSVYDSSKSSTNPRKNHPHWHTYPSQAKADVPYLVHVYISGRYILISSVQPLVLILARTPLAIVLHLLDKLFGKRLRDQRVPVDIRTRLQGEKVVSIGRHSHDYVNLSYSKITRAL